MLFVLISHLKRPLPFLQMNWTGRGQLFYLLFLWWIVVMNFVHVLLRFTPIRLITEGTLTVNAVICTILVVYGARTEMRVLPSTDRAYFPVIRNAIVYGLLGAIAVPFIGYGIKRACWGDKPAGIVNTDQIRFGPNNTNTIK